MCRRGPTRVVSCAIVLAVTLPALTAPLQADEQAQFQKLLADAAPATVTIKFVLKTRSSWGESEDEREVSGVMIAPDGLVLCASSNLGADRWMSRSGGTATPTDIKILVGDDTEGLDARLIARDSELDLSWLRIEDPGERKFAFVPLGEAPTPEIGERVYSVGRLGKYFDRAPVVREGRIGGITTKPRRLYYPTGDVGGLGLPCYDGRGEVIGVFVTQLPDPEEMEGAGSEWFGGYGLILPTTEVIKATRRAQEIAELDEEE
jgi:S1-C subfamily serine protease